MKSNSLAIPEVIVFEPLAFEDDRGLFFESFNQREFDRVVGFPVTFVQDNQSRSRKGVLRGLHLQIAPHAQGKLVRVLSGAIFDVAVDLRRGSTTYRQWVSQTLTAANRKQIWVPVGFAHGFVALEDDTEVVYKTTAFYDPASERSILWSDPTLAIDWPQMDKILSPKDRHAPVLSAVEHHT